jgi:ubiquinone/menaquinone biosynthesis C-methylase UbiE
MYSVPATDMSYSVGYFTTRESWRDWCIEACHLMDLMRAPRGARVLEIGCGGGGLLRLLRERGVNVVGVDTLDAALNLAHERFTTENLVRLGDDDALPFCNGAFDAVVAQHVIEHLPDVIAALCEWKRILKPGGRIVLATPNARYPDPAHFADMDHTRVFAPRELRDAASRAGIMVETCYTIFPFLSRVRSLRAFSVLTYRVFQHAPYFATRGRTIVLSAQKR